MKKRTIFEDTAAMALIYTNKATGNKMISYDKVIQFDKIINENLDEMNSIIKPFQFYEEKSELYFYATDENDKLYLVIKPDADLKKAQSYHIDYLPHDILVASQMKNALEILGLQLINGKLVQNDNFKKYLKEAIKKIIDNPRNFYIKIANSLTIEEREYLKETIENKSCFNCSNGTCKVETFDKTSNEVCVAWDNKELIGKQKIKK